MLTFNEVLNIFSYALQSKMPFWEPSVLRKTEKNTGVVKGMKKNNHSMSVCAFLLRLAEHIDNLQYRSPNS